MKIGVFTFGEVDLQTVYRLVCNLEERFLCNFLVESSLSIPTGAFHPQKKQYFAPTLLARVKDALSPKIKYALSITQVDLYGISLNYIFGDADINQQVGIIGYHRLRPEFYGHQNNSVLLFDRILKESMHQFSHLLGAKHCYSSQCVLYYPNTIYDMDNKPSLFCSDCEKKLIRPRQARF